VTGQDFNLAILLGELAALAHIVIAFAVTFHVLLYKRDVGSAVAWIGIAWLSPFLGGLLYAIMGINRVKRRAQRLRRERLIATDAEATQAIAASAATDPYSPLEFAIGRLTGLPCEDGNRIEMLHSGDQAYPRMLAAIEGAQHSVGLVSYIFRNDKAGQAFHRALIAAKQRGVEVRVLIDGVGSGYFWSGTYVALSKAGVPVARFLHSYLPWRMPFVNLRNHRKVLVIDGRLAFTGGLNIGAENIRADNPPEIVLDTHFELEGPIVDQLVDAFADDWLYIVLPEHSNHTILDWARRVPLRPLIVAGCTIWLRPAPFDHSKLMVIDDQWSLIGSANWDTRSFRLNFELNVELHDPGFAQQIVAATAANQRLKLADLDNEPLPLRLRNGAARLLQPYL